MSPMSALSTSDLTGSRHISDRVESETRDLIDEAASIRDLVKNELSASQRRESLLMEELRNTRRQLDDRRMVDDSILEKAAENEEMLSTAVMELDDEKHRLARELSDTQERHNHEHRLRRFMEETMAESEQYMTSRLKEANAQVGGLTEESARARAKLSAAEIRIKELEAAHAADLDVGKQLVTVTEWNRKLTQRVNSLETQLDVFRAKEVQADRVESELNSSRAHVTGLSSQVTRSRKREESLRAELDQSRENRQALREENRLLTRTVDDLRAELMTASEQHAVRDRQLSTAAMHLERGLATAETQYRETEEKLQDTQASLNLTRQAATEAAETAGVNIQRVSELEERVTTVEAELEQERQEAQAWRERAMSLEETLAGVKEDAERLMSALSTCRQTEKELAGDLDQVAEERDQLRLAYDSEREVRQEKERQLAVLTDNQTVVRDQMGSIEGAVSEAHSGLARIPALIQMQMAVLEEQLRRMGAVSAHLDDQEAEQAQQ
ncbi:hypothetical protein KIPB_002025 [Kipferlia bialata]|uniref:Uncharacterized protein n=1 Tax=Kipferlia bialata TaxID=797122 RepID=A0A9K3GGD3_9EUKA|nr:hypothetical protein KIPB_002025 [Kipferlia bialata]|eukprot:g2025.t1